MPASPLRVLLIVALLTGCARSDDDAVLRTLAAQLATHYGECIPLGWSPAPASGTYYPGVSVTVEEEGVWLPARWIGYVRTRDKVRPDIRTVSDVLDALTRAGMLLRDEVRGGSRYHLSTAAVPFYYDESDYHDNPPHVPYLCYSTIVPQRVLSMDAVHRERLRNAAHDVEAFHVTFAWRRSAAAAWARDAFLRRHSVNLAPTQNPITATLVHRDGDWVIAALSGPSPGGRVADVSAWPTPRR